MSLFERFLKVMFSSLHQVMKSDQKLLVKEHIMNKTVWGRTLRRRGRGLFVNVNVNVAIERTKCVGIVRNDKKCVGIVRNDIFQDTLFSVVRHPIKKKKHSAKHAQFSCLLSIFNRTYANLGHPASSKFDWDWVRLLIFFVKVWLCLITDLNRTSSFS